MSVRASIRSGDGWSVVKGGSACIYEARGEEQPSCLGLRPGEAEHGWSTACSRSCRNTDIACIELTAPATRSLGRLDPLAHLRLVVERIAARWHLRTPPVP